jgi:hypothetical protein
MEHHKDLGAEWKHFPGMSCLALDAPSYRGDNSAVGYIGLSSKHTRIRRDSGFVQSLDPSQSAGDCIALVKIRSGFDRKSDCLL